MRINTIIVFLAVSVLAMFAATPSGAGDIIELISQYRREHGLPAVKTDPRLTAIAQRQAQAMASSGIMDHSVAGSFSTRISSASLAEAAENIAAGTRTWDDTLRMWKQSPGHNRNLLTPGADLLGVAVARNDNTRYKVYWAMVIGRRDSVRHRGKTVVAGKNATQGGTTGGGTAATEATSGGSSVGEWVNETVTSIKNLLP